MASIAVIGGTGQLGKALARRLARAGHTVTIGSRSAEAAAMVVAELRPQLGPEAAIAHAANEDAARGGDIVIVTVPHAAQAATLAAIAPALSAQAIVVDTTVPLVPPKVMRVQLPAAGSAAQEARAALPEATRLVTAFHSVSAHVLAGDGRVDCDVLVFSDDVPARNAIVALCGDIALRGLSGGPLANSAAAEALTSILIYMNKTYGADGAGIRFTGLATAPAIP